MPEQHPATEQIAGPVVEENVQQPTSRPIPGASVPAPMVPPVPTVSSVERSPIGTGLQMKPRNPVGAWLGLPLVTFGIYHYVWYYKIHNEMAQFDRRRRISPAGSMLVLLLLAWTFVAPLVSYYNTGKRIADAQRAAGLAPSCSPGIGLLLCFAFGLQVLYYQAELNKVVQRYQAPEGTQVPLFV